MRKYGNEWIVDIKDITDFVHKQYKHVVNKQYDELQVAEERVYPVINPLIIKQIRLQDESQD